MRLARTKQCPNDASTLPHAPETPATFAPQDRPFLKNPKFHRTRYPKKNHPQFSIIKLVKEPDETPASRGAVRVVWVSLLPPRADKPDDRPDEGDEREPE